MADVDQQTSISSDRVPLELTVGQFHAGRPGLAPMPPRTWDVASVLTRALLDRAEAQLAQAGGDLTVPMSDLMTGLADLRARSSPEVWEAVIEQSRAHRVCELLHQDPFTARSFHKPRGYAGDAVLIDFIYSRSCRVSEADHVSPLGERLFAFNRDTPACRAVRTRRDLIAVAIDAACEAVDRPRLLSVACGHLREAGLSKAFVDRRVGQFVALDQDELSVRVVRDQFGSAGVVPVCNSIKALFRGELAREKFDFVYSTGLYDYLDDRLAAKLTERLFDMLNPGGRLLVANFLPDLWGSGYMETFMDWRLTYRSAAQMASLAAGIDPAQVRQARTFVEDENNIVFLDVNRT